MEHLVFLVQLASIAAGFVAVSLLFSVPREARRAGAAFLGAGVLAQTLRLVFFAALRYGRLSRLRELPGDRFDYWTMLLAYRASLCVGAWFLSSWLLKRAGARWNRVAAAAYWLFYGLSAVILVVRLGTEPSAQRFASALRFLLVDVGPVAVDKLAILVSAAVWLAVAKKRAPGDLRGRPLELSAVLLVALAAILDGILIWMPSNALFVLLTAFPFFLAAFLAYAAFRVESGTRGAPETSGRPDASRALDGLIDKAGLSALERRMAEAIVRGRSNKEIAFEEGLSLPAVKHRLYALYRRLGVASRYELIALAAGERPAGSGADA